MGVERAPQPVLEGNQGQPAQSWANNSYIHARLLGEFAESAVGSWPQLGSPPLRGQKRRAHARMNYRRQKLWPKHGSGRRGDLKETEEEGLDAHLHVLGFEDDAVRTLPYAPQDAVLLHGPLPGTLTLRSYSPSLAPDPSALARPGFRPRRGCLATTQKRAPGPGGRRQLEVTSGPLSAFP